jgi:hypothetical protein
LNLPSTDNPAVTDLGKVFRGRSVTRIDRGVSDRRALRAREPARRPAATAPGDLVDPTGAAYNHGHVVRLSKVDGTTD